MHENTTIYIHTHACMNTPQYTYTHMHAYAVTYIHKDDTGIQMIGTYLSAHMHECMHAYTAIYIHTHACMTTDHRYHTQVPYIHTCYIRTCINTYISTHRHT